MKSNLYLLLSLLLMAVVILFLIFKNGESGGFATEDKSFAIADTSSITKVTFEMGDRAVNVLDKNNGTWTVNRKHLADENLPHVLLSAMTNVKVTRGASKNENNEMVVRIKEQGIKTTFFSGSKVLSSIFVLGDPQTEKTWFYAPEDEKAFIVELPGYSSFLAGIFNLTENDWRNKVIFSSTWNSILQVNISYSNLPDKSTVIKFEKDKFLINGKPVSDSARFNNFVGQLEKVKASFLVPQGANPTFDSLAQLKPFLTISLTDVDSLKNNKLELFNERPVNGFILGRSQKHANEFVLMDLRVIRNLVY